MRCAFTTAMVALAASAVTAAAPAPPEQQTGRGMSISKHDGLLNADNTVNFGALNAHIAFVSAKLFGNEEEERHTGTPSVKGQTQEAGKPSVGDKA